MASKSSRSGSKSTKSSGGKSKSGSRSGSRSRSGSGSGKSRSSSRGETHNRSGARTESRRVESDSSTKAPRDKSRGSSNGRSKSRSKTRKREEFDDYSVVDPKDIPEGPDVLIDVPVVKVDKIDIEVDDLHAQVAVLAEVRSWSRSSVGAQAQPRQGAS